MTEQRPAAVRSGTEPDAPVAINARAAVRREIGGVERVARELVAQLPQISPGRYRVVAPRPALAHGAGHAWEQLALPVLARRSDIVLSPANLAPYAGARNVVLIHDVAPFVGDWYSSLYARWHRLLVPRVARRAERVVTDSTAVRDQLVERLGVHPDQIWVVALGVGGHFGADADPAPAAARYGLDRPYVLAVGTDVPRKNFDLLDRVAPALGREGIEVVIAGSTRPYMPRGDYGVRSLGYVDDALLPGLYAGARALAMPSLYEGFGLPCLEAMACATPVVASSAPALPETCGNAALLVDPHDADAFARALLEASGPTTTRARLIDAGVQRAARHSWRDSAEQLDGHIGRLLGTA
ncbi:MAG: glycosyltransferase family 4 protein [Thermoleophilaceae bacterium]